MSHEGSGTNGVFAARNLFLPMAFTAEHAQPLYMIDAARYWLCGFLARRVFFVVFCVFPVGLNNQ
jgi:hypothetical protein